MRRWRRTMTAAAFAVAMHTSPSRAAEPPNLFAEMIHSPVPLYSFEWEGTWPRSFRSDNDFGCSSRVAFGDWHFVPAYPDGSETEHWERFSNYGVFHCAAMIRSSDEQSELKEANSDYGLFVQIGTAKLGSANWELWVVQRGFRPGSQYTLLAREPGTGMIERFNVLQQQCPPGTQLEAKSMDIWKTRYCAINSRADLTALARRMLKLPHRGTLTRVAETK